MLTIHITEAAVTAHTADESGNTDDLPACLAQYGVPSDMIQTALTALPQVKTVVLCQPSEAEAWAIVGPQGLLP